MLDLHVWLAFAIDTPTLILKSIDLSDKKRADFCL